MQCSAVQCSAVACVLCPECSPVPPLPPLPPLPPPRTGLVHTATAHCSSYGIFDTELSRLGLTARSGPVTASQVELDSPPLDFVQLAKGLGCRATAARTERQLAEQLQVMGCRLSGAECRGRM